MVTFPASAGTKLIGLLIDDRGTCVCEQLVQGCTRQRPTTRSRVPHGARDQHTLVIQVRRINEVWWSGKEISSLSPVLKHALLMN